MTITGDFLLGTTTGTVQGTWLPSFQYFSFTVNVPRGGIREFPDCTMTYNQSNLNAHTSGAPGTNSAYLEGGFYGQFSGTSIALGALQLLKQ